MYKAVISICFVLITIFSFSPLLAKDHLPITLKQIVEARSIVDVKVSPDGKYFAYLQLVPRNVLVEEDGKPYLELYVSDPTGNTKRFISGKKRIGSISWGAKSQFIYFIALREQDRYASIYRISVEGGEAEKVVGSHSDISAYTVNSDESGLTYLAMPAESEAEAKLLRKGFNAKVYEESDNKKSAYYVDLLEPNSVHFQLNIKQHIHTVDYHPNKEMLLIRSAPTGSKDDAYTASQYQVVLQNGRVVQRFETEGKLSIAQWSPDGKQVAIIGAENKNDPASGRLYVAEVKSGKLREFIKDYLGHVKDIQWLSNSQLAFLGHIGTQSEIAIINLDSGEITPKFEVGEMVITSIHGDSSGSIMAGIASSDAHPREVVNLSSKRAVRISRSNPWLESIKLPRQETISFKARDGVDIQGVLIYPTNHSEQKKYPLIMIVHGGPERHVSDGWLDKYSYPIKYAAQKGFAIFLPNYRGSTGRGVDFSKLGQADYAGAEFNDLVDAIQYLTESGLVDKKRVGITGSSYGGYASAWGATALSDYFAASVMFVGISDQISKFGTTDVPEEIYNIHARKYPWDDWEWMLERSPIYHSHKAKTPLLILHGENDTRVHPSQSMELYRYIKTRTDTPVRLVLYPNEGHGNKNNAAQLDYALRLMRWMEFYLQGNNDKKEMPPYGMAHLLNFDS